MKRFRAFCVDISFFEIVIRNWIPTIFTVGMGGYLASVLFPRLQARFHTNRQMIEKRFLLAEQAMCCLATYAVFWRRIILISSLEIKRPLDEHEGPRKKCFVEQRNKCREELLMTLVKCRLYFSSSAGELISEFMAWDEQNSSKNLFELPAVEEWQKWRDKISIALKRELEMAYV